MSTTQLIAEEYIDDADWGSVAALVSQQSISTVPDFQPVTLFFYGTLTIPRVIKHVLQTAEDPLLLRPAQISGYSLRLWGPYPALIKSEQEEELGSPISGVAYKVRTEEHLDRLVTYEGENYILSDVFIRLQGEGDVDDKESIAGKTFIWNGYPEDLADGKFEVSVFKEDHDSV
ncbi:hypothetical protein ABW19_dt0204420 [Dactylella cylindrospora]|nr:hypothetical protein ABW19_dt0204420 [Dactylella cylindrospora]